MTGHRYQMPTLLEDLLCGRRGFAYSMYILGDTWLHLLVMTASLRTAMRATSIAVVPAQVWMMAVPVRLMPIVPVMCAKPAPA